MSSDKSMIAIEEVVTIVSVRVTVAPSAIDEFFKYFKPAYDAVVAESECRFFTVGLDPKEPGAIFWTEGWTKDTEWFMSVQFKKDYYKPYLEATEPMFVKESTYMSTFRILYA